MYNKITIYIHPNAILALGEIAENLRLYLIKQGYDAVISESINLHDLNILFGLQEIINKPIDFSIPTNSIIFNLEQLYDGSKYVPLPYLELLKLYEVWDYNSINQKWLKENLNITAKVIRLGYQKEFEQVEFKYDHEKDIDVLFYGPLNERRKHIISMLKNHTDIKVVHTGCGIFGHDRNELIARSKIVINIHYHDTAILEYYRVLYLLNNNCFVITENSNDINDYQYILPGLVVVDDIYKFADITALYLGNYQKRRQIADNGYNLLKDQQFVVPLDNFTKNHRNYNQPELDVKFYLYKYQDLSKNGINTNTAMTHFLKFGMYENRIPNSKILEKFQQDYTKIRSKPCILLISHDYGGGSIKYEYDLINLTADKFNFVFLYENCDHRLVLQIGNVYRRYFNKFDDFISLLDILNKIGVQGIIVNHAISISAEYVNRIVNDIKLPYLNIIHDLHYLQHNNPHIESLINNSTLNIIPSISCMNDYKSDFKTTNFKVIPHNILDYDATIDYNINPKKLKVLIIGSIHGKNKGLEQLIALDDYLVNNPTVEHEFSLLGITPYEPKKINVIGKFKNDNDFKNKVSNINPDVLFIISRCNETFCYMFSTACTTGIPILVYDYPIFKERQDATNLKDIIFLNNNESSSKHIIDTLDNYKWPDTVTKYKIENDINFEYKQIFDRYFTNNALISYMYPNNVDNIKYYCICGERCSGTNFLQKSMDENTNLKITPSERFGFNHWFGFSNYQQSDDTLFICIVRNPYEWLYSLFIQQHHFADHLRKNFTDFLTKEWYTYYDLSEHGEHKGKEIMEDRNIYTYERYKNIFEMRKIKCQFMLDDLSKLVKNYILIKYEDLRDNFNNTMLTIIKQFGLTQLNYNLIATNEYKEVNRKFIKQLYKDKIQDQDLQIINDNIDWQLEQKIGYSQEN